MKDCPLCNNARHIRKDGKWERCSCILDHLSLSYLKPVFRAPATVEIPEGLIAWLPFSNRLYLGDFQPFRSMARFSLSTYWQPRNLTYEVIDPSRLVEIYLGQDEDYKRVRDLDTPDLVILLSGLNDPPNKMIPFLIQQLMSIRVQSDKSMWIFHKGGSFPGGETVTELLQSFKIFTQAEYRRFDYPKATTPSPKPSTPAVSPTDI